MTIEKLTQRIEQLERAVYRSPNSIFKTAEEVAPIIGMRPDRLLELARSGYAPHYLGPFEEPRFKSGEIREWIKDTAIARNPYPFPKQLTILDGSSPERRNGALPGELVAIQGLIEIPLSSESITGIYFLCRDGKCCYVGGSTRVFGRICDHKSEGLKKFDSAYFLPCPQSELKKTEDEFCELLKPEYNLRQDGSYRG